MPIPNKYLADFEEVGIYHIYNRTNNQEKLFLSDDNRIFFLKRYKEILSEFIDTYCWCLLPNHFHLLIKVKTEDAVITYLQSKPQTDLTITEKKYLRTRVVNLPKVYNPEKQHNTNLAQHSKQRVVNLPKVDNPGSEQVDNPLVTFSELIEQTFKRFFQSYALAFNKQHNRQGNLFYRPFKRIRIEKDIQFTMAIIYIHANAAKHKLVKDFTTYPWSSWHSIISNLPTLILREEIIDWFGSLDIFIKTHKEMAEYYYDCDIAFEDSGVC